MFEKKPTGSRGGNVDTKWKKSHENIKIFQYLLSKGLGKLFPGLLLERQKFLLV